jgi:hypothetical protein
MHPLSFHEPADEKELESVDAGGPSAFDLHWWCANCYPEGNDRDAGTWNHLAQPLCGIRRDCRNRIGCAYDHAEDGSQERELSIDPGKLHPEERTNERYAAEPLRYNPDETMRNRPEGVDEVECSAPHEPGGSKRAAKHVTRHECEEQRPLPNPVRRRLIVSKGFPAGRPIAKTVYLDVVHYLVALAAICGREHLDHDSALLEAVNHLDQPWGDDVSRGARERARDEQNFHL